MAGRALLLSALCAALLTLVPAAPAAAAGGVDVRASTTYAVRPEDRLVRVTVDVTVRNVTPDTARRRFFYTGYALAIPPEATKLAATSGRRRLAVESRRAKDHLEARVAFGRRLFRLQSLTFRLQFDLADGGARSASSTRVGRSYVAFYAHAYGEERGNVRVQLPAGFDVQTQGSPLAARPTGGQGAAVLSATGLTKPREWSAWVSAQRAGALRSERLQVPIGGRARPVEIRAWPEDTQWTDTVRSRLTTGLPVLGELVGIEWPITGTLRVVERHAPLLGGYAGFYDLATHEIQMSEQLDEQVTLHEVSHAWFNESLFRERWINEGLADEYASQATRRLGRSGHSPSPVARHDAPAFPLNDWGRFKPAAAEREREAYGYDASWGVLRAIVDEVGADAMRGVLVAAQRRETPYLGGGGPEPVPGVADWRRFLDLLEERAGSRLAPSMFERWVVSDADRAQLTARATARTEYRALAAAAAPWQVPYAVRDPMARWDFAAARRAIADANAVVERRDRMERLARSLGLTPSGDLRAAYETAQADLAGALRVADGELAALETIERGTRTVGGADFDLIGRLGLVGSDPAARLRDARDAFAAQDFERSGALVAEAVAEVERASRLGQERATVAAAGAAAATAILVAVILVVRRRRRRRRALT